ncbi:MAG TPA: NUDIX hydrolase [Thermomicrobiaceae bacterium]|nr:NUDIX hydrolase [Thermomicrobiaceae bacterium]
MSARGDRPTGRALGWRVVATRELVSTPWINLRQDEVQVAGHGQITYTYLHQTPAVYVVPVMADGRVVLIRQYRYPVDDWCLEVPAGGSHDRPGVPLREVAREELREEAGGRCGAIERVGSFYSANTHSDQESHVFLALKVELGGTPAREGTERIEVVPTPAREAVELARTGRVSDAASALALLLCEDLLRRYGYLERG